MSSGNDFIRAEGNLSYTSMWLKLLCFVLIIISLVLAGVIALLAIDRTSVRVVPIVINEATGDAMAVDYRVIDATGEQRQPVEVRKFCRDFLSDAYIFNRFTARSNLESLANYFTQESLAQIRESLNLSRRSEYIGRGAQGLFEITSFMILETQPALRIQIYFRESVVSANGDLLEESNQLAIVTVRAVRRTEQNPHGLIVIEYRQNNFEPIKEVSK